MKKQLNDGFKMWGNYLQAIDEFTKGDDAKFGRFMRIICNYGIYGEELAETEIEKFFFTSVKKSIDASVTNIKNGKKGGAGNTAATNDFVKPTLKEITEYCKRNNMVYAGDKELTQQCAQNKAENERRFNERFEAGLRQELLRRL